MHTIVELMGGNIQVQSKEDIGSTFIVEVPMKVVKASDDASVEIEQEEEPVPVLRHGIYESRVVAQLAGL